MTITVYSAELPTDTTYTFDLSKMNTTEEEFVEYYNVYTDGTIQFDSKRGPWYNINYNTKEILGCTSEGAQIITCDEDNNMLTLVVFSNELPANVTYTFDLTQNVTEPNEYGCGFGDFDGHDTVEFFNILPYENTIEWDSQYGPYYKINLSNGEIIECTSDYLYPSSPKAKVLFYSYYGDNITFTVHSEELPYDMTYVFNTKTHTQVCGIGGYDKEASEEEFSRILNEIFAGIYEGKGVDKETADKIHQAHKNNQKIVTLVETSSMSEKRVNQDVFNKVEGTLKHEGFESIQYIEISIVVYADGQELGKITQLTNSINFTLDTSDDVMNQDNNYYVARVHDETIDILETESKEDNRMSFETDRFSTYVLVSKNKEQDVNDSNTDTDSGDDFSNDSTVTNSEDSTDTDMNENDSTSSPNTDSNENTGTESNENITTEANDDKDNNSNASVSTDNNNTTNDADFNNPSTSPKDDKGDFNIWSIIIPVLLVCGIGAGIVIFFVIKKNSNKE